MPNDQVNEDIRSTLSKYELQLCAHLRRIDIRGKRGRKVPLIFTRKNESAVKLLVECRPELGIPSENSFVFAVLNG